MQHNMDVELQSTLCELCTDLFTHTALDDCDAILQSLVQLADTFPQTQTMLGRHCSGAGLLKTTTHKCEHAMRGANEG